MMVIILRKHDLRNEDIFTGRVKNVSVKFIEYSGFIIAPGSQEVQFHGAIIHKMVYP